MVRRFRVFLLVLLWTVGAAGGEWTGYLKNFSLVTDPPGSILPDSMLSSSTRLRLQYQGWLNDRWSVAGAGELAFVAQHHYLFAADSAALSVSTNTYRISDPDRLWLPSEPAVDDNTALMFNLDRVRLAWRGEKLEISMGRQAVSWGSGKAVNPTDVLMPYTFTELDTEYRVGVDAVRLRYAVNLMSELDAGYVFGPGGDMADSAVYLRGKTYLANTDLSALVMRFQNHLMIGLDVTRAWGGSGVWLEAAFVDADHFAATATSRDYVRVSAGIDRQLTPAVYGYLEYHFNGSGRDVDDPGYGLVDPAALEGSVYLVARHYLSLGAAWQLSGLTTVNGMLITNLDDHSMFLSLSLDRSLSDNLYLALGTYLSTGDAPATGMPIPALPLIRDEFGSYADLIYGSVRWYF